MENSGNFESWQKGNDVVNTIIGYFNDFQPTIATTDTNTVKELAKEHYPYNVDNDILDIVEMQAFKQVGFIAGHTAAIEALKKNIVRILIKHGTDEITLNKAIELIESL